MTKSYRAYNLTQVVGTAVNWTLPVYDNYDIKRLAIRLSGNVTVPEALQVILNHNGIAWLLRSQNMIGCNYQSWENIDGINAMDTLTITFPNTDALTIDGFASVDLTP
jgi:hypothetical protein